ncbi:MAG: transcriptional regulator [Desulfobacteraceae bacterium 4572_88]|nr:MAG: transcriptional regulator [Desulfobacteraceae bacterium 4572_88]RLC08293.1 MAG: transcriptional regulator [Deltaproteobacteria bacterium]
MRDSIKEAVAETIQDMMDSGLSSSFTKKELDSLGVKVPDIRLAQDQVKAIRKRMNLSQTVFAKMLNVSLSSVRQWEQGKRKPTGSTIVLLELLEKKPYILRHRINK